MLVLSAALKLIEPFVLKTFAKMLNVILKTVESQILLKTLDG